MKRRILTVCGLIALILVGILLSTNPIAAQETPSIDISVDGESVSEGEEVVVPQANLSVVVTGTVELESVVVRVNGEDEVTAAPNDSAFARTLSTPFKSGSNTVQVIVKDETDALTSRQISVYKDTYRPNIGLERPFEIAPGNQFPSSFEVNNASVTISGSVSDASNVTDFSARVIGGGQSDEVTELTDGHFSFTTSLVPGNNSLIVSATDEYGHRSYRSTQIRVIDENDPVLTVNNWPNVTERAMIQPTITVTDDGGVRSLTYRIPGQGIHTLVEPTSKVLGAGRTNVSVSPELEFYRPGSYNVTFNATDYVNGSVEEIQTIEYDPVTPEERVSPDITITESQSGVVNESIYRLRANVTNGSISKVFIEAAPENEGPTFFETIYQGPNTTQYHIAENISIASGQNEIIIKVTDALGTVHQQTFEVDTATTQPYPPPTTQPPQTTTSPGTKTGSEMTTEPEPADDPLTTTHQNTTAVPGTTVSNQTSSDTKGTTTDQITRISVTKNTPITAKTETSSPLSPILTVVAFGLAVVLFFRRD